MNDRISRALLALYPRAWRARYGAEVTELVADLRADGVRPWRIGADLVRGAGTERLRIAELVGDGPAPSRARGGSLLVLWAWAWFVLVGCALQKFAEHWSDPVAQEHRALPTAAFGVLVGAAACAAALVAVGLAVALPGLGRGLRSGLWPAVRRCVRVAVGFTVAAVLGTAVLVTWATHLTDAQRNGHDPAYAAAFLACAALGVSCLVAWTVVASTAARRVDLPDRVLRIHARLGVAVTAAMAVMSVATLTWWIALERTAPSALHGRPMGLPAVALTGMALGTVMAAAGSRRSGRAVRDLQG